MPVDLVIDHSVQVDLFAHAEAYAATSSCEYRAQRGALRVPPVGAAGVRNFRVVPAGRRASCHQVNLEHLGQVVAVRDGVAFPDTLVGTDSHTTMINGLGVLGWGVGGIEAEAAMLGQPISLPSPIVVGVQADRRAARPGRPRPTSC